MKTLAQTQTQVHPHPLGFSEVVRTLARSSYGTAFTFEVKRKTPQGSLRQVLIAPTRKQALAVAHAIFDGKVKNWEPENVE